MGEPMPLITPLGRGATQLPEAAPLHADVADGPDNGRAFWLQTSDNVRLRLGLWGEGSAGTVLIMPGRTEYVEKYGRAAHSFVAAGLQVAVLDWRGQGLADRLISNEKLGHIPEFRDYQNDVAAMMAAADALELPRPYHLLAHSMGGAIALRALIGGLDVQSTAFSAPMWGISLDIFRRPAAWAVTSIARQVGLSEFLAPGTKEDNYAVLNPFDDNMLTTDQAMYDYMRDQLLAYPTLAVGGPTMTWLHEALKECRSLQRHPTPNYSTVTFLGTGERIVDCDAIHDRMARWSNGHLEMIEGGEHEVMMETPEIRTRVLEQMIAHFRAHS